MGERPPMTFKVGDEVVWTSMNHKGAKRYRVEKVGRTLVHIDGDRKPYRLDGRRNDKYGHECIRSLPVWEWDESVEAARAYFAEHRICDAWRADPEWVVWAAGVLRDAEKEARDER